MDQIHDLILEPEVALRVLIFSFVQFLQHRQLCTLCIQEDVTALQHHNGQLWSIL